MRGIVFAPRYVGMKAPIANVRVTRGRTRIWGHDCETDIVETALFDKVPGVLKDIRGIRIQPKHKETHYANPELLDCANHAFVFLNIALGLATKVAAVAGVDGLKANKELVHMG